MCSAHAFIKCTILLIYVAVLGLLPAATADTKAKVDRTQTDYFFGISLSTNFTSQNPVTKIANGIVIKTAISPTPILAPIVQKLSSTWAWV